MSNNPDSLPLIQPVTETDWASCFDLRWRVLRQPWNQPRGSERDPADSSSYHLMLKTPDGLAAAVGRLHLNSPTEAQVRFMAVDPAWRRKGLGGRVLKGLEAQARALGARKVILNAREEAVAFYLGHGYQVEGPADTLFGAVRHMRMRKRLPLDTQ